jgi:FKBP-type peptidyl-prolyl cis-trans isomerase SlyD
MVKVNDQDFIEVDYTGRLEDGTVFDTTLENVAKENNIYNPNMKLKPAVVCVGQGQLVSGLDKDFVGKEVGQDLKVNLEAQNAFGKRDIKRMRIVPMNDFKQHKVQPRPGLEIDIDGERGIVSKVAGGRVIVNFNHPLAGRNISYSYKINRVVLDASEQIKAFLNTSMKIREDAMNIEIVDGKKAVVKLPNALPAGLGEILGKKIASLVKLDSVEFALDRKE